MYGHWLVDLRDARGSLDGFLNDLVAEMVPPNHARARIGRQRLTRKDPEPSQFAAGIRILPFERIREPHARETGLASS